MTWNNDNNAPLYPRDEAELADTIKKHHSAVVAPMEFLVGREGLRGMDAAHPMFYDPMEAQEDGMLLNANGIFMGGDVFSGNAYITHTGSPDADPKRFLYHFLFLRVFYQLWQKNWRGAPLERWIIKAPYYTHELASCLHVLSQSAKPGGPHVPVAALVGKRDARDMIPSEIRLMSRVTIIYGAAQGRGLDDVRLVAKEILQRVRKGFFTPKVPTEENSEEGHLLASRTVTYEYSDLVRDPEGYVKRLVETHPNVLGSAPNGVGMSWSQSWAHGVQAYLEKNNEMRKRQKEEGLLGTLSLEECGVSEEDLRDAGIA